MTSIWCQCISLLHFHILERDPAGIMTTNSSTWICVFFSSNYWAQQYSIWGECRAERYWKKNIWYLNLFSKTLHNWFVNLKYHYSPFIASHFCTFTDGEKMFLFLIRVIFIKKCFTSKYEYNISVWLFCFLVISNLDADISITCLFSMFLFHSTHCIRSFDVRLTQKLDSGSTDVLAVLFGYFGSAVLLG